MPRITVIGSSNVDFVTQVDHLPSPGETVAGGMFQQVFGGKGANTAVAVARLRSEDHDAALITAVGNDPFARLMLENFDREGLDISASVKLDSAPSGTAQIIVDKSGQNIIAVSPGANERLTPTHIDNAEALIRNSALVIMQLEVAPVTVTHALARCREWGVPVMLNYAPLREQELSVDDSIALLVVNELEAAGLCGREATTPACAMSAAAELKARGPATVVVTLGEQGAVIVHEQSRLHVPAPQVSTVDATAAGDTFCGALAIATVEARPVEEAMRFAVTAASLSTTRHGAQPSIPTRKEVEREMNKDA